MTESKTCQTNGTVPFSCPMKNLRITSVSIVALACTAIQANAQDYRYAVFELPGLGSPFQFNATAGINSAGNVVGGVGFGQNFAHAALWPHGGGIIDLGTLGGDHSGAASINELGDIAGWAGFEPGRSIYVRHACIWRNGNIIDLGTLGGESSYANAINDAGQAVGASEFEFGNYHEMACLWNNGGAFALPGLLEGQSGRAAFDINNAGDIVGWDFDSQNRPAAVLWRDSEAIGLETLSDRGSQAYGINEDGVIVGYSRMPNDYVHAVKWVNGEIEDIHTFSIGLNSIANDINNVDQIVGDAYASSRAFILNPGEQMMLLDDLVPPRLHLDWTMKRATEINDSGQIPVTANIGNDLWALLLTPVHPTMNLRSPLPGTAGTSNRLRVNGVTPGQRVVFLYSLHGGGTRIPGCDLQENTLQLDAPKVIGSAIANQNGVATITRHVPLLARGQTILFQAVVQNECAISQLVVWQFD